MSKGSVTCAECGALMKADRTHCLRCEAPLPTPSAAPTPSAPEQTPVPVNDRTRIAAVVGAAAGLLLVAFLWGNRPAANVPNGPTVAAGGTSVAEAPRAVAPTPETPTLAPVTSLDSARAASAAFASGDFQNARTQFEQALEKNPDDHEALNNLGLTLERLGDVPGAIDRFERAAMLAADKWTYHFNLAHALARQSSWERAVAEYRQASQLFPEDYATQFNLALTLQKQGDHVAAIPEFEKAITLAPGEPTFHIALGNSLVKAGRLADAQRAFRQYLELAPDAPDAAKVKAHLEALAAAEKAPPVPAATTASAKP